MFILRLIGAVILLGVLAGLVFGVDMALNHGRLFYAALGRNTLVSLCTPPMRDDLTKRGFTPADIELSERPSISFESGSFGRTRTLASAFTFSDGPDGPRVDGQFVCVVSGSRVEVKVEVDGRPLRAA